MASSATKTRETTTDQKKVPFKATTRCDQCGAQAYIRAEKTNGDSASTELFFCIHHGDKNQVGLIAQGFLMDDRRWAL